MAIKRPFGDFFAMSHEAVWFLFGVGGCNRLPSNEFSNFASLAVEPTVAPGEKKGET